MHKIKVSESECEANVTLTELTTTQSTIATVKARLNLAQTVNAEKDTAIMGLEKEK